MLSRTVTAFLALTSATGALPSPHWPIYPRQNSTNSTLNSAIVAAGRSYIGAALTIRDDAAEQGLIAGPEFGSITPENAMKWESVQPTQGQFTFDSADAIANFATESGKEIRCHTLVWYSQLPAWVSEIQSNATLIEVVTEHIETAMGRYRGRCTHWDVVNEALNEDGTLRDNVFLRLIGEQYLPIAFRLAAAADPEAKLYYNDYNLEYGTAKHEGALRIVELVQSWGVKIDGVGLQAHLTSEPTDTANGAVTPSVEILTQVLQDYADLGVDVAYTELDVRMNTPSTPEKLEEQGEAYARVAESCINVERCIGITLWGVSDKYSWIPEVFSGEGAALLWDENIQKKPAYTAFLNALSV